jgi:hypothetical protein
MTGGDLKSSGVVRSLQHCHGHKDEDEDKMNLHADLARRRETEVHDLYAFSRRLAAAHTPNDIYTAIREHLASIIGRRTILFETAPPGVPGAALSGEGEVPEEVKRATDALAESRKGSDHNSVVEDDEGRVWLVRPVSGKAGDFGVLAIDLGQQKGKMADAITERVDAVLADATAMLEHLDLGRALSDSRVRSETEALRDALIGSVSHQLRTPLVSILGAATVISSATGNRAARDCRVAWRRPHRQPQEGYATDEGKPPVRAAAPAFHCNDRQRSRRADIPQPRQEHCADKPRGRHSPRRGSRFSV